MFKNSNDLNKFRHLIKERWDVQGLNAVPAYIHAGPITGIIGMKEVLDYGYTKFILQYEKDFCYLHYNRDDMHRNFEEFLKRYRKNKGYLKFLWDTSEELVEDAYDYINYNMNKLEKLETSDLLKEYHHYFEIFCNMFNVSHIVESIALTTDVPLKNMLMKELEKKKKGDKFNEYFTFLTQPNEMPFIVEMNNTTSKILEAIKSSKELLNLFNDKNANVKDNNTHIKELIKKIQEDDKLNNLIKSHVHRFYWIKTSWAGGKELTLFDFVEELKAHIVSNETMEFTLPKKFEDIKKEKKEMIKQLKPSKELLELIEIIEFIAYWQDIRKIQMLRGVQALECFVNEISKRVNISVELLRYLLTEELNLITEMSTEKLTKFLEERRQGCAFLHDNETMMIITGKDYISFFDEMKKAKEHSEVKEIMGMCASVGKAIGLVKVCLKPHQLSKFKEGEILVTSMTRPEFVPAMKKAAGIVTDEGGLTCHAAILSRELGKPCIIGTKIATKILKEGMKVEVDANHGVVKIIM